jgi:N-acyl-D-amino-acid deacylase
LWTLALVDWQRDDTTDAMVHFLLVNQKEDGHWSVSSRRPPLEESKQSTTAMAAYFLRRYAAPEKEEQAAEAVEKALAWLRDSAIESQEDANGVAWGLHVLGADDADVEKARQAAIARQHADGGWSQIPGMESDAYATGQTLAVLASTGWDPGADAYRRGMAFLLRTQKEDGSWRVETRARPVQEFFDNGDPHGKHQFISIPATSWAVTALAVGLEP